MPTPSFILPSAPVYEEGTLYGLELYGSNFMPSPMSFTRATTATRVNADGLVELVPYNLVQYSQTFTNGVWGNGGYGNIATVVANDTTAPDGTMTASKATFTAGSTQGRLIQQVAVTNGGVYSASIYVKYGNKNTISFYCDAAVIGLNADFNFTTKVLTANGVTNPIVTELENGWFRLQFQYTAPSATSQIGFITNIGEDGFIYTWGAQLVEGTEALPYLKTETRLNRPRVDFSLPGCPNLLLEPQRTNLVTYSEQLDNASWQKINGGSGSVPIVTANTAISPSGVQNADRIQLSLNGGTTLADISYLNKAVSATSAATFSIYAKSNTTPCTIYFRSGTVATAINITTEWQRFEFYNSVAINVVQLGLRGASYGGAVNSDTADISVWGAQLEAGAYATSYIPTTTASVTRNADSFTESNVFSRGMITAAGGTWFVELRDNFAYNSGSGAIQLGLGNNAVGVNANNIWIAPAASGRIRIWKQVAGTLTPLFTTATDIVKTAIKWDGSTADVFVNGVKVVSATSFNATDLETLRTIVVQQPYLINQMALFPTPLSDDQLEALTGEGFNTYAEMASYYNYTLQ